MDTSSHLKYQNNKGYTLLELLIYITIFAIAAGMFSGILVIFTRVQSQEAASAEVTQQLSFVQSTIQRLVREAVNIENKLGVATSTLKLRMEDVSKDPTCLSLINGVIKLAEGPDPTNPENCTTETSDLTSDRVNASEFQVTKYENPGGHAVVQVDLSLTYNSTRLYQQVTRNLKTAIGRVTAATFDDNLLPNIPGEGSIGYSIGVPSTRWKSLSLSNLLNLGQLATDPVDAQPGSIYYNTASSTFRGYKAGEWQNLGEGFWTASSTAIYNTNTGNVGIGTTNPTGKLYIQDPSAAYKFTSSSTSGYVTTFNMDNTGLDIGHNSPNRSLNLITNNADRLTITGGGNVGIGTTNPSAALEVNGRIKDKTGFVMPVGSILPYGGATAPTGWFLCNGSTVSRTTYADLFAAIDTAYGAGDGSTTFNIPDLRGRFIRGIDSGLGRDPDAATRTAMATGGNTGDNVGSVQQDAFQNITGAMNNTYAATARSGVTGVFTGSTQSSGPATTYPVGGYAGSQPTAQEVFNAANSPGARTSTETRPKNAYLNFIIKY